MNKEINELLQELYKDLDYKHTRILDQLVRAIIKDLDRMIAPLEVTNNP